MNDVPEERRAWRAFELMLATTFLLAALPAAAVIALLIKCGSPGPVIYSSRRLGLHRRMIGVLKFRTMELERSGSLDELLRRDESRRREWAFRRKLRRDPRLTREGVWLRRLSLDELPQLINVIRGDMALVGPRPIVPEEEVHYGRYSQMLHSVRPGITGLWQVSGRNCIGYRRRVAMNIYYVRNRSAGLDLWILWRTIQAVLSGHGAY